MKTRNFGIFGALLAALAIFLISTTATAQQNALSDTLIYPDPIFAVERLRDFGPVTSGKSECHTIYLKNSSTDPLIIQAADLGYDPGDFTVKPIPSLPVILLHNEIISIASLCYTPLNPTITMESKIISITGTSNNIRVNVNASFTGTEIVDPILQKTCDSISLDADLFGPIIMDGDVTHTATIESNRYDSLWVVIDSQKTVAVNPPFSISGISFPYHLAPREVKKFNLTFSPRSNVPKVQYRFVGALSLATFTNFTDTGSYPYFFGKCNLMYLSLPGVAIPPTADSISTALTAGSTDVLAMISDNSVTAQTFHFKNTGSTNLKITAVDLKNKKSFAITNIQPSMTLPFTLTPGQSMSVTVGMTTVSNGVYYDEVIITAENALISMNFPLQGLRKNGLAGLHNTLPVSEHLMLYPNPSHGSISVDIPGIHNANIQVLDLLGRVVAAAVASEKWIWNSTELAGTYILHLTGADETGKTFQSYDRFIIAK